MPASGRTAIESLATLDRDDLRELIPAPVTIVLMSFTFNLVYPYG